MTPTGLVGEAFRKQKASEKKKRPLKLRSGKREGYATSSPLFLLDSGCNNQRIHRK